MLQMRTENGMLVSPMRDIAHNFPWLVEETVKRLDEKVWGELHELIDAKGITEEQLAIVIDSMVKFVTKASDPEVKEPFALLESSGFLDVSPSARVAVMAVLGQIVLGAYFEGVRQASVLDERMPPKATVEALVKTGRQVSQRICRRRASAIRRLWLAIRNLF